MSLRGGTAVVVAGVVAVLGGCTSTGEPVVSPSPVVSAVVTPSPSPSLSHEEQMLALIPEEAKGDDLFAAEAMAKFFISLHPGLYQGDDPALWEFLCLPESVFCSSNLTSSAERLARGEVQTGGEVSFPEQFPELVLDVDASVPTAYVGLRTDQAPLMFTGSDGSQVSEKGATTYFVAFRLVFTGALWRVSGVEVTDLEHE